MFQPPTTAYPPFAKRKGTRASEAKLAGDARTRFQTCPFAGARLESHRYNFETLDTLEVTTIVRQHRQTVMDGSATYQKVEIADRRSRSPQSSAFPTEKSANIVVQTKHIATRKETQKITLFTFRVMREVNPVIHLRKRDHANPHTLVDQFIQPRPEPRLPVQTVNNPVRID